MTSVKKSKHCRRWRCIHVVGCLCNCKACAKLRPEEEIAESWKNFERDRALRESQDLRREVKP